MPADRNQKMGSLNDRLHERLDDEDERELCVTVLTSFERELRAAIEKKGWKDDEGMRQILAAGLRTVDGWTSPEKPLDKMTLEEQLTFQRDRAASLDAAYATMKFLAYQVMNQNDALEMNMKGLMPQLEGARTRIADLEEEIRRLRALVPADQRQGKALVFDQPPTEPEHKSMGDRIRDAFRR